MKIYMLTLCVLILMSCKAGHKPVAKLMYDRNFETLNSKVKQIIEISNERYHGIDTTITDFDVHGNISQIMKIGYNGYTDNWQYQYDKTCKPIKAIKNNGRWPTVVCSYDKMGRIADLSYSTKELNDTSDHFMKQDIARFKYDSVGYLYAYDRYLDTKHLQIKKYKYNKKHLLIATEVLSTSGINGYKKSYKYQLFDKKGNWLKRIITTSDQSEKDDTVTRNIVYY